MTDDISGGFAERGLITTHKDNDNTAMTYNTLNYSWYVLHTRSRFENVVHDGLYKKSMEVFLPKIKVPSRRRDRKLMLKVPLFPGYL
jgi:hypothetical protein